MGFVFLLVLYLSNICLKLVAFALSFPISHLFLIVTLIQMSPRFHSFIRINRITARRESGCAYLDNRRFVAWERSCNASNDHLRGLSSSNLSRSDLDLLVPPEELRPLKF